MSSMSVPSTNDRKVPMRDSLLNALQVREGQSGDDDG